MKALLITSLAVCSFICASAQDGARVRALELRVQRLEEKLAVMEKLTAARQVTDEAEEQMALAKKREAAERQTNKREDIANAERLYQRAAKMLGDNRSKPLLDSVVSAYPQLNRAGCAQLYRAQQEYGPEMERLLKDCIARFGECYYLDGAQVGPLAMLKLADHYELTGREEDAHKLYKRIRKEYPDAVGHNGQLLTDQMGR